MSNAIQTSTDGTTTTIRINGKFDFSNHGEFSAAYRNTKDPGMDYCIDLSQVSYLDSSALGMLLMLREHANSHNGNVIIKGPSEEILKLLTVSSFDKIFTINN